MTSFIEIHIPHFLLDLKLLHLLDLVWCQLILLRRVLLHAHCIRILLHAHSVRIWRHTHWNLLRHTLRHLLLVTRLLHVYVDVNIWVNHCLILIRLVNYIRVASHVHCRLLLWNIIVPKSLLNHRSSRLKRHRLEPLIFINNWLVKRFKRISAFLILVGLYISREVKHICLLLARGALLLGIILKVQRKEIISSLLLRADLALNFLFLWYDIVKVKEVFVLNVLVKLCFSLGFPSMLLVELNIILRWLLIARLPLELIRHSLHLRKSSTRGFCGGLNSTFWGLDIRWILGGNFFVWVRVIKWVCGFLFYFWLLPEDSKINYLLRLRNIIDLVPVQLLKNVLENGQNFEPVVAVQSLRQILI